MSHFEAKSAPAVRQHTWYTATPGRTVFREDAVTCNYGADCHCPTYEVNEQEHPNKHASLQRYSREWKVRWQVAMRHARVKAAEDCAQKRKKADKATQNNAEDCGKPP